jgi:signal transduction histidine kinase
MAERLTAGRVVASRWFDPALAALLVGVSLVQLYTAPGMTSSLRAPVAVVLIGGAVAFRRSHPQIAAAVQAAVFLATPNFDDNFLPEVGAIAPSIVAYSCGAHAANRSGLAAVVALAVCMQIGMQFTEFPNFEVYFATLGPWWVGTQVRRRRRLVGELRERTSQLEAEQDAFARLAVRRERARIARELHDIVAHHLAVIVVQAGAGRMAPATQVDRNAERFASIRESGGHALEEMARLVDLLDAGRDGESGAFGKLRVLLDEAAAGGIPVRLTPLPVGVRLPPETEEAAYRVVQEGLTNAIKHAPGAAILVRVSTPGDEVEVEVRNGAAATSSALAPTGSGLGLPGMRERVESLGGTLDAGPTSGGGWRVTARLPIRLPAVTTVP